MNKVILVGRTSKDIDLKATPTGTSVATFSLACDRKYSKEGEEKKTDFINCVAWRQTAESLKKFVTKGTRIALEGTLQTRSWKDNEGKNHYVTEVIVDNWEFAQSKNENTFNKSPDTIIDDFNPIETDDFPWE